MTGSGLTIEDVVAVARSRERVAPYPPSAIARMEASRRWIADVIERDAKTVYGVNTGFGSLAPVLIASSQARQLSRTLILTCLVGVGEPLPLDLQEELHLRSDRVAIAYRSWLRQLGVQFGVA